MKIEVSEQVARWVPRRLLREGLRGLAREQGDIKALEGPLENYFRLLIGGYRIIFAYRSGTGRLRTVQCIFAERRGAVYEVFAEMLRKHLLGGE